MMQNLELITKNLKGRLTPNFIQHVYVFEELEFNLKMLETLFKNQVLMTFVIASIWIIPGILVTSAAKRKTRNLEKEKQLKRISKLYPQTLH